MTNSAIGSSLIAPATGYWKPVTSGTSAGGAASTSIADHGRTDAVSVSKLGQALNGAAADLFKHLDSKARGTLEGLVNSGRISADEVVTGLKSLATKAAFNRYVAERPRDDEDRQRLAASEAAWQKLQTYGSRISDARSAMGRTMSDLQDAQQRGDITMDEMADRLRPVQEDFKSQIAEAQATYGRPSDQTDVLADAGGFTKNVKGFVAAMSSLGPDSGFLAPYSPDGNAAEQKLQTLGFDASAYGGALKAFAAGVDIPGIGRKTPAAEPAPAEPAPAEPAEDTAAPATAGSSRASSQPEAGATPAAQESEVKTPTSDPGNAQAALSLLQSALASSASKSGISGVLGARSGDAGESHDKPANALLQALKSGAGQAKTDDMGSV